MILFKSWETTFGEGCFFYMKNINRIKNKPFECENIAYGTCFHIQRVILADYLAIDYVQIN